MYIKKIFALLLSFGIVLSSVAFAEPQKADLLKIEKDIQTGMVYLSGTGTLADDNVTIEVLSPGKTEADLNEVSEKDGFSEIDSVVAYFGQVKTDDEGRYESAFELDDINSDYSVRVKFDKANETAVGTIDFQNDFAGGVSVTAATENNAEFFNPEDTVKVHAYIKSESAKDEDCTIKYDIVRDGRIIDSKTEKITVGVGETYDYQILPKDKLMGSYSVDITVIDELYIHEEKLNFTIVKKVSAAAADDFAGLATHLYTTDVNSDEFKDAVELLKKSGASYVREDYFWDRVELSNGRYTFYADDQINALVENGIRPHVILCYSNSLHGGYPHDDEGYKAYAAYAKAIAEKYRGKIDTFEIMNEWSTAWNGGYGVEEYANILKYTYEALKSVDEDITVVAGAIIGPDINWFRSLFDIELDGKGMYEYCDAISYHPYTHYSPDSKIESTADSMMAMMKEYGEPKPLWITEVGWASHTAGISEEKQAEYLAKTYIQARSKGVDKIFWYNFRSKGTDPASEEHNFGIVSQWNESEGRYRLKPAYFSYAAVTEFLSGKNFVKEYNPQPDIRVFHFGNSQTGEDVYAIYNKSGNTVEASLAGEYRCYDMKGNEIEFTEIGSEPVYLTTSTNGVNPDNIKIGDDVEADEAKLNVSANGKTVIISGNTGVEDDTVTIEVLKPDTKTESLNGLEGTGIFAIDSLICHFEQIRTDRQGNYNTSFEMPGDDGTYPVRVRFADSGEVLSGDVVVGSGSVKSIHFTDADGVEISNLASAGNTLKVTANIENKTGEVSLYVAVYNADGRLEKVVKRDKTLIGNGTESIDTVIDLNGLQISDEWYASAFVWGYNLTPAVQNENIAY